jgi:hypothetical protein
MKSRNQARRPAQRSTISPAITDALVATNELSKHMAALSGLTAQQLRDEWRRLYRGQPPRLSRDLLIRSIAYRMQELVHGGLSKATQRTLATLSKEMEASGNVTIAPDLRVRSGARLVREWRGRTHTVIVTDDGFEYAGKAYASLTKIAHEITSAHWSGPRFFGLNRKQDTGGPRSSSRRLVETEASHG